MSRVFCEYIIIDTTQVACKVSKKGSIIKLEYFNKLLDLSLSDTVKVDGTLCIVLGKRNLYYTSKAIKIIELMVEPIKLDNLLEL